MKTLKEWCVENNEMTLLELYESGGNNKKRESIAEITTILSREPLFRLLLR